MGAISKNRYAISRRRRTSIIIACVLLAVGLIGLEHSSLRRKWQRQPKSQEQVKARDFEKYHAKNFTVASVLDGDTIDIDIPDGRHNTTRIRLWGIDTPETTHETYGAMYFGPEAAAFARQLVLGKEVSVYLEAEKHTRDKYDRLLAYVQLPDGRFLNEVLVSEGFAYADLRFRHSLHNKYQQLEASARSSKKGLWENVTREQLPEWLQRMKPDLLR